MNSTVRGTYESDDQRRNAEDDLIACGIPRDQIFVDAPAHKIRVLVPAASRPGVVEMLERHGLAVGAP
jgi:hypothetical protein